jgi:hypothetical protein
MLCEQCGLERGLRWDDKLMPIAVCHPRRCRKTRPASIPLVEESSAPAGLLVQASRPSSQRRDIRASRAIVRLHRLEGSAVSYGTLDVDDIALIREHVLEQSGWGKVIVVDPENYARSFELTS